MLSLLERLQSVFERGPGMGEDGSASQRIAELERLVGRLAMENEVLRNAARWREGRLPRSGR